MTDYLHGAYGQINAVGNRVADEAQGAFVYVGTAPVQTVAGGADNVNVPVLVRNIAEAKKRFGYSEDWDKYTLCEAIHAHFEICGVGPLVLINVFDPSKMQATDNTSVDKTPSDGAFTIADAENILLDTVSVVVKATQVAKVEGTDYTKSYDATTKVLTFTEKTAGSLGTAELTISYTYTVVSSVSKTPANGAIVIASAENIILDTVEVATKTKGTDYTLAYDSEKQTITIREITSGALGTSALTITYKSADATQVTTSDVIGYSDGLGDNTGIYAVKDVYQLTGYIPSFLVCPGFSSIPNVHKVMYENSVKVNGHWDVFMMTDIPIVDGGTGITFDTAATWKSTNGYNKENEKVFFPLAEGTDGKIYHLSVLASVNMQTLLMNQDGIPFRSSSNTEAGLIKNLYLGVDNAGRIFDDYIINEKLNKNGIASAAFVGGRWAIWGAHCADYTQATANQINVAETNRLMLYYISNDFQARRIRDVDQPLTPNDIRAIAAEEQARLDALINIGALTYGTVTVNASADTRSDILNGDWSFAFNVTTTPLAKSLTAIVTWTDAGFVTYFEDAVA